MKELLRNKNILVVGLGFRTGLSTANFLVSTGARVTVSDSKSPEELRDIISQLDPSVKVLTGKQEISILSHGFDFIVLSPGVPQRIPLIQEAMKKGIEVISEIELASRFLNCTIIAITGTDGKSTTTSLVNFVLRKIGIDSYEAGNIGIPLVSLIEKLNSNSVVVLELSSFQLELVNTFKADIAAILNISPDHLDRYDSMKDYLDAKFNIINNQDNGDYFILNLDDKNIVERKEKIKSKIFSFSLDKNSDIIYEDGFIKLNTGNEFLPVIEVSRLKLLGIHNIKNVMSALLIINALFEKKKEKIDYNILAEAFYLYKGLEHRMELIGEFNKRKFINDSKATTIGATQMALESVGNSSIFIIGGQPKGDDYCRLYESLKQRVKSVVLIGETKENFNEIFVEVDKYKAETMDDAVKIAYSNSEENDVIILSPACASFDMFKSFEDRGRVFKNSFKKLQEGTL